MTGFLNITNINLPFKCVEEFYQNLRNAGRKRLEGVALLAGKAKGSTFNVTATIIPAQTSYNLESGLLYSVNGEELFRINKWLYENEHLNTFYPYDEIRSLLLSILSDGKIDEEERIVLLAYFNQFVNLNNNEIKEKINELTKDVTISGLCTSEPDVTFDGKTFCITGILQRGNREVLQNRIEDLGGIPTDNLTKKTDYLIVGDNGNPAWAFSCYGRKVEKALQMRKEGHTIVMIHEFDFFDIVDDLG